MKWGLLLALLVGCICVFNVSADYEPIVLKPNTPEIVRKALAASESMKQQGKEQCDADLPDLRKRLAGAKAAEVQSGKVKEKYIQRTDSYYYVFPSVQAKDAAISTIQEKIQKYETVLSVVNDPELLLLPQNPLDAVGDFGRIDAISKVVSVMDKRTLLVLIGTEQLFVLRNIDTAKVVDGQAMGFSSKAIWYIAGTESYASASGASRTVFALDRYYLSDWIASPATAPSK